MGILSFSKGCWGWIGPMRQGNDAQKQGQTQAMVRDDDSRIMACICESPLLGVCHIEKQDIERNLEEYKRLSSHMIETMGMPASFEKMSVAEQKRVYQYYLPVYLWCASQLEEHKKKEEGPLILGISAPQGCGKSTLCEQLESLFEYKGLRAASVSIDDFYLTREDQISVANTYNGNKLLEMRGNAGSHEVDLGTKTLKSLKAATTEDSEVALPRYDKSAYQGKGDRADPSTWPKVRGPVDVVLFEGWMLGFSHVSDKQAGSVDPDLKIVNRFLKKYKKAWDSYVDAWFVIKVADPQFSFTWRLQAEKRMRASGKPAMTDDEVATFVDRFMPAYKCYLPGLYEKGPTTSTPKKLLVVEVDDNRNPINQQ